MTRNCTADLILQDAWEQASRTLGLVPDGAMRARVKLVLKGEADADMTVTTVAEGMRRILHRADRMVKGLEQDRASAEAVIAGLAAHREVYRTPHLPAFECDMITPRLFAGRNPLTERDVEWLEDMGVTHVLDLREEVEWRSPRFGADAVNRLGARRRWLPVPDRGAPTPLMLDQACSYLDQVLAIPDAVVYVHCRAGRERTAAILVAHRALCCGVGYDEALAVLRRQRYILAPLPNQERAVRGWLAVRGKGGGRPFAGGTPV